MFVVVVLLCYMLSIRTKEINVAFFSFFQIFLAQIIYFSSFCNNLLPQ